MFSTFSQVTAQPDTIQHVLASMLEANPNDPYTCSCHVRQPLLGLDPGSPAFPRALRESLARLRACQETTVSRTELAVKTAAWIDPFWLEKTLIPAFGLFSSIPSARWSSPDKRDGLFFNSL